MKYEIIKGREKYFEGLPSDYIAIYSHGVGFGKIFAKNGELIPGDYLLIAERRPITDPVVNQQLTTEWDGEGLPPVGCHCEVKAGKDSWNLCKIVFSDNVAGVAFVYLGGDEEKYVGSVDCIGAACAPFYFRVMHASEYSVRDEAKGIIADLCRSSASNGHSADLIYDAIAAGKIPGIKLES